LLHSQTRSTFDSTFLRRHEKFNPKGGDDNAYSTISFVIIARVIPIPIPMTLKMQLSST
jgi:hypothetical protein